MAQENHLKEIEDFSEATMISDHLKTKTTLLRICKLITLPLLAITKVS